ncbi:MAG: RNA-binding protein [Candidatus Aminicenantes bacterium]|nr:RNA-binding protein [Candidatus Aminicenantes bacterium]
MKIYVGNIPREVTDDDLKQAFEAYGQIESVAIIKDKFTGESRGFGFIEMPSASEANAAISGINGKELKGRSLKVNEARPREDNRGGGGGGGGRPFGGRKPSGGKRRF